MNTIINADIEKDILATFKKEAEYCGKEFSLFKDIPDKKLKNATSSYASTLTHDETAVMLYDPTIFGSAKEGFLLTTRRLFCKSRSNNSGYTELCDIKNIIKTKEARSEQTIEDITIITKSGSFCFDSYQWKAGQKEAYIRVLIGIIRLLGGLVSSVTPSTGQVSSSQEVKCAGCGAINAGSAKFCEYCQADLSEARCSVTTAALNNTTYYREYPDILDFGAFIGLQRIKSIDYSNSLTLNFIYYYDESKITKENIQDYIKALQESGVEYDEFNEDELVHYLSTDEKEIMIYLSDDANELCIDISVLK